MSLRNPRSNIPAPGSLKFGAKKEEKLFPSSDQDQPTSSVRTSIAGPLTDCASNLNDGDSKRQSLVAAVVGNVAHQPQSSCDSSPKRFDQTFTGEKLLTRLIEDKFSTAIGCPVCIAGEKYGTLKYFGPLHVAEGLFCGIELEEEQGQHDGFIDGRRYFKALPRHGIFAPVEKVKIVDKSGTAAKLVHKSPESGSSKKMNGAVANKKDLDQTYTRNDMFAVSASDDVSSNAELLEEIEPHLVMTYSMLDDDNPSGDGAPSFELSDSLMFVKNFAGFDGSMSASQLSSMILSSEGAVVGQLKPNDATFDQDDVEKLYFDEQSTPVFDNNSFLNEIENSFSKNGAALAASTPLDANFDQVTASQKIQVSARQNSTQPVNDNAAILSETFAVNENVQFRQSSSLVSSKKTSERPVSTVSADTGYQGDTEYETQSGRSVSPPDDHLDVSFEKQQKLDKTMSIQKAGSTPPSVGACENRFTQNDADFRVSNSDAVDERRVSLDSSTESLICETIFRDRSGKVVKVIRGDLSNAPPAGATSMNGSGMKQSATIEDFKKCITDDNKPPVVDMNGTFDKSSTQKRENAKKSSPEASPTKNKRLKSEVTAMRTKAADKKPEILEPVRQKPVKEAVVDPPPQKKPRPPPKPSKAAEIMAKLQQSIAQEKAKPKKEVKSRVFTAGDATKSEEVSSLQLPPSRSQSRASSTVASAQLSPSDVGAVVTEAGDSKSSSHENGVEESNDHNTTVVKKAGGKVVEQGKPLGKVLKRDNSHHDMATKPPSSSSASKRLPVTKTASLSGSNRFTKINGIGSHQVSSSFTSPTASTISNKASKVITDKKNVEQLVLAKEQLKHTSIGFDAMCITIKHYAEEVIPSLYIQLSEIKNDLCVARESSNSLLAENSALHVEKEQMCKTQEMTVENLNKEHDEAIRKQESGLRSESEKKMFEMTNAHNAEIKQLYDQFRHQEKRLVKGYEKRQLDDAAQLQHKISQLKDQQTKELEDLKIAHAKELADLKFQCENVESNLKAKLVESQQLCDRYKSESRELESTLMKDAEKKIHHVNERFSVYKQEIDSLRVVVEMKSAEVHDFRMKCQTLEKELETLPVAKTKIAVLEQKNAELKEALDQKKQTEKRLSSMHMELQLSCEREKERAKRLSMNNEQLQYRLQHLMMSQSAYETPMSRFPADDSDIVDTAIRDKPMSQSLIHIYAGSSPRSHKDVPVTVYTTEGISKALLFDTSDSERTEHTRKRTSSERKSSLSDGSSTSPPAVVNRAKSVDKSASVSSSPSQRRISPLRRRNVSGASLVGAPGVETVNEMCEDAKDCCGEHHEGKTDDDGGSSSDAQEANLRKVCKSSSQQGQGCWTDSGVFTNSFHSETAVLPESSSSSEILASGEKNSDDHQQKLDTDSTPKK